MIYPIRICRLKNMEIWELRLGEADGVFCYFSLVDNTLLNLDNEKENYLAIDIHTNVDLQNYSNVDYEELITMIECLYENMMLSIESKISLHSYSINTDKINIQDEELYGSETQQIASYLDEVIREKCFGLVEKKIKLSLEQINNGSFCQDSYL